MASARRVGKYEVGRTIGEGTFAKVKFANNTDTGECVAIKVLSKSTILKHKMLDQIKREISIMKIVRHPFIVRLHEVLAGRAKIYIVLELVAGGELFDKIAQQGKLSETESQRYFQQLIQAVSHCHDKGVYHRDLKPENLLLDSHGNLKVSDFGLSALPHEGVTLLYTTCGTPNYVAPEVISHLRKLLFLCCTKRSMLLSFLVHFGFLPLQVDSYGSYLIQILQLQWRSQEFSKEGAKSCGSRVYSRRSREKNFLGNK